MSRTRQEEVHEGAVVTLACLLSPPLPPSRHLRVRVFCFPLSLRRFSHSRWRRPYRGIKRATRGFGHGGRRLAWRLLGSVQGRIPSPGTGEVKSEIADLHDVDGVMHSAAAGGGGVAGSQVGCKGCGSAHALPSSSNLVGRGTFASCAGERGSHWPSLSREVGTELKRFGE